MLSFYSNNYIVDIGIKTDFKEVCCCYVSFLN